MLIGVMSVVIVILNLVLKKSKSLYLVTFFWMWLLMAGTYGIADESIYISRYNNPSIWSLTTEFLYFWIILLCNNLGMSFVEFKVIITFVQLILIFSTIWKYGTYPNIVVALYFLFPFPLHIAQMRSALATSIFIWGLRYIIQDNEPIKDKKLKLTSNDIKYICTVVVASCIHTASIGWLVLLIAKKMSVKFNIMFAFISNILILFVFSPENILRIINIFGGGTRISAYFSEAYQLSSARQYGNLIGIIFTSIIFIILAAYLLRHNKTVTESKQAGLLMRCNISILFTLSVVVRYTGEVYRLQEGMVILNLLLVLNLIDSNKFYINKISKHNLIVIIGLLLYTIGIIWIRLLRSLIPTIVLPILKNNLFIHF